MKTKNIIMTVAIGAALVSAPLAKANDLSMELISGTSSVFGTVSLTGISFSGTINGWNLTANANSIVSPINQSVDSFNIMANGTAPLTIAVWGDDYNVTGLETAFAGVSETSTSAALIGGFNTYYQNQTNGVTPTLLTTQSFNDTGITGSIGQNTSAPISAGEYFLGDFITLTGGLGEVQADLAVSAPDGGMTLMMLGSGLVVLAGIRSKFGSKLN
jgi:hypothetical protein